MSLVMCNETSSVNCTNNIDLCYDPDEGEYDLDLHIASVFVVMISSWLGAILPIVAIRFQTFHFAQRFFYIAKFFGAGVITATGYAFRQRLNNTALGSFTSSLRLWSRCQTLASQHGFLRITHRLPVYLQCFQRWPCTP